MVRHRHFSARKARETATLYQIFAWRTHQDYHYLVEHRRWGLRRYHVIEIKYGNNIIPFKSREFSERQHG